jgi:ATP-binding cassette subfamily E protein 1
MKKRIMVVNKERCNPVGCGGYLCIKVSPSNRMGKEAIVKSADGKVEVNEDVMSDADIIAAHKCPFHALDMIRLPDTLDKAPVHRYGKNGFALYSLPIPIFGKVVGIIGKNGIGKSTAIKILAGTLQPNLGNVDEWDKNYEASHEELIEYFKGTEAQTFFEKRKKGDIKIGYKPQAVDLIPKSFDGKVGELLKKVDEKGIMEEIVKELSLANFLDNKLTEISGGELQRVAIAATVMKKANVYIFDEPTSYLDIKQRIKVSKFIRGLADEDTAVLVIEHDLIILDYMTDLIHLMYGKEDAYGIVSLMKNTKTGINIYLDGYMKDENMRFRDYKITFFDAPEDESQQSSEVISSWDKFDKKLGKFSLTAEAGKINRKDVIGILGENGIGKTSFVKILAKVDEPDSGKVSEDIKVSYKPQYIQGDDELVMTHLLEAITKYKAQLVIPLNLEMLFMKKLSELSGGQLQRVAIAYCLSQEADLFLLDEPSAYLDVEQRLIVSKVIKSVMQDKGKSALIVDHDLLFIDYLSDKLMVFDGEPAISGIAKGPFEMGDGMNMFLGDLGITMRRDEENHRPRVNKVGSQKDREQKEKKSLYY